MTAKKTRRIPRTSYLLAIIFSVGFLVAGLVFLLFAGHQSRLETMQYINDATQQSKFNIDSHIDEEFQILNTGIILSEEREWLADDDSFDRMTRRILGSNPYTRVGIAAPDGKVLWADPTGRRVRADFSEEEYIQKALAGENAISELEWDKISGTYVNNYAIPVYTKEGTLRGALFASDPEEQLREVIDNSLFANEGFSQIVRDDGTYVIKSDSPLRLTGDKGIFDMQAPLEPGMQQDVLGDMSKRRSGYAIFNTDSGTRITAYTPSKYNNWYIFYSVPEKLVNAGIRNIMYGVMTIIAIAIGIFLFFLLMIRRDNIKNRKQLENMAFVDPVTGGMNLQKFKIEARKFLDTNPREDYAICYADIKGFKYINNIFGYNTGDQLLRFMWKIFNDRGMSQEVFARASSDIFVAIVLYKSKESMEKRFLGATAQFAKFPPAAAKGYKLNLYGGVYHINKQDGVLTIEDMLDRALEAQQDVKKSNAGSRLGFYNNEMRMQKLWESEVESKMEDALESGEFKLYMQPKINIQGVESIMGMEALVRWEPPEEDIIPPSRFINIFERNGFITKLDYFMIEQACMVYMDHAYGALDPFPVLSVNVSRITLFQPDMVKICSNIKEKYQIPDGAIELEFTEGLFSENQEQFKVILKELHSYGFLCSLDDFGSGYSSLNLLKSLEVDVLKLDKVFFKHEGNEERGHELVKMIISLAKDFDMKTVAEGIDDSNDISWLRSIGCDGIQGYVYSKPLPLDEFDRFISEWDKDQG